MSCIHSLLEMPDDVLGLSVTLVMTSGSVEEGGGGGVVYQFLCGWVGGWISGWISGWVSGWISGWVSGWISGWVSGWINGWVSECGMYVGLLITTH